MTPTPKVKPTLLWSLSGLALLAALSIPFVTSSDSRAPAPPPRDGWAAYSASVKSGAFNVDVMLHARLEAGQSVTLSSGLPSNMAKILELAPDGSYLREGELVARFDRRPLDEAIRKLNSELRDAQTQLQQLRADYALMVNEGKERSAQLDYNGKLADTEMQQVLEVELPTKEARATRDYRKAVAEYDTLKAKHATQLELVEKGLGTRVDLAAAEAALRAADAELAIVRGELEGLRTVTLPAEREHARLKAANARREHQAFEATLSQRLQKHTGSIRRAENKLIDLEEELAEAQDHLALTELRAPVTGILLHRRVSAGLEKRKPQVGDSLWKGHAFAVIPDMSSMIAEAAVSEREVGKLAVGQTVQLVPDAYPDLVLKGSVASIGTLVESEQGEPQFSVRIGLSDSDERLRPGMSGRVAVRTAALNHALRIPVQAVFIDELKPVAFRLHGGDISRVDLVLGPSDGRDVVVTAGLERNDHVLMVYPETVQ